MSRQKGLVVGWIEGVSKIRRIKVETGGGSDKRTER